MISYANNTGIRAPHSVCSLDIPDAITMAAMPLPCALDNIALRMIFRTMNANFSPPYVERNSSVPAEKPSKTDRRIRILGILRNEGPISTAELALEIGVSRSKTLDTLTRMEIAGEVYRQGEGLRTTWMHNVEVKAAPSGVAP